MAKWKLTEHKVSSNQQELSVRILVKEMLEINITYSNEWIDRFHSRLKDIKRKNIFSAEHAYKATPRNESSLEIWKMKTNGDYNYKMFTVTLVDKTPYNPFNF